MTVVETVFEKVKSSISLVKGVTHSMKKRSALKFFEPVEKYSEDWSALEEKSREWENMYRQRWSQDRKSTRLNSSHVAISYAVFCLKKKKVKDLAIKFDPAKDTQEG